MDETAFDALIGDIYLSATEAEARERLPDAFARLVGGVHAVLWTVDPMTGVPASPGMTNVPVDAQQLYYDHYCRIDPWMTRRHLMGWDRVVRGEELIPNRELAQSEYYNDYGRRLDTFHVIGTRLSLGGGPGTAFGAAAVLRPERHRPFTPAEEARMRRLLPLGTAGPCRVTVSPLPRPVAGPGRVLVTVLPQALPRDAAAPGRAQRLFGLTRSEAEVALALADGASPSEIAETRGVRMPTVRTQLAQAMEKAGADDLRGLAIRLTLLRG